MGADQQQGWGPSADLAYPVTAAALIAGTVGLAVVAVGVLRRWVRG